MKTWKKILIGLALMAIVFASGIVIYITSINVMPFHPPPEKIVIQAAQYNFTDNSIYIYLQYLQSPNGNQINLTSAIVKDDDGKTVTTISTSDTVNAYNRKNYPYPVQTLVVHLNSTLPSGNYTVTLITAKDSSFVSPNFNVP